MLSREPHVGAARAASALPLEHRAAFAPTAPQCRSGPERRVTRSVTALMRGSLLGKQMVARQRFACREREIGAADPLGNAGRSALSPAGWVGALRVEYAPECTNPERSVLPVLERCRRHLGRARRGHPAWIAGLQAASGGPVAGGSRAMSGKRSRTSSRRRSPGPGYSRPSGRWKVRVPSAWRS